jgi:hypothetical protein
VNSTLGGFQSGEPHKNAPGERSAEFDAQVGDRRWVIITGISDPNARQSQLDQFERVAKRAITTLNQKHALAEAALETWLCLVAL